MRRTAMLGIAAVAATVAVAVVATSGSAQQGQGKGQERTIVLTERDRGSTFRFIDNPPRSRLNRGEFPRRISTGDEFVATSPVYDAANTTRVGSFYAHCSVVLGRKTFGRSRFLCDAIHKLADGSLSLHATFMGSETIVGSVIGGTASYEGANGSFTSQEQRGSSKDTLHLLR
jgi:hypothetical protein